MAGLSLSSPAPQTLVVHRLVDLVLEVWTDSGMARQQLVVSPCHHLWRSSKELAPKTPPRWRLVLSSGVPDAVCNPLGSRPVPSLGGHPRHVGRAGLPPVVIWHRVVGLCSVGCGHCALACPPIAQNSPMSWDPARGGLVASRPQPGANLDGHGETLVGPDAV